VGVSSVKMAQTPQGIPTQGMGFAIAGETVRGKVTQFLRAAEGLPPPRNGEEQVSRAWKYLGLQLRDLTGDERDRMQIAPGQGVLVTSIDPRSPAGESGFGEGLVIFQVGKYEVGSARQVEELLEPVSAGSVIDLTIGLMRRGARGASQRQLQLVTLTAR
jgi:S1-C subfamily serine protease